MALPSNVGFGTITGRFIRAVVDSGDAGRDPDGEPLAGLTVTFEASPTPAIARNITADPPVTVVLEKITATTNSDGVLIGPDDAEGIKLVAGGDPDLDPTGWSWKVTISGATFPRVSFAFILQPDTIVDLSTVVPVPPNPGAALEAWQAAVTTTLEAAASVERGIPGGVAGLDADGDVIDANGTKITSGGGGGSGHTHANLTILDATTASFTTADETKLDGIAAGATVNATDAALRDRATHTGTQSADTLTDGTTNKAFLATERTKLTGIATGATANATDTQLRDRTTHTGTQSADTLTDGTTNKAFLATERTKLTGIATGATANDTDTNLKNRANHTGTQAATTITGLATVATTGAYGDLTGKPTIPAAYTDEQVRDVVGATLVAGTNVALNVNDAGDTITINAPAAGVSAVLDTDDPIPGGTPAGIVVRLAG